MQWVPRRSATTLVAGSTAALLAFGSAAVTAYWALGGTALLDTVGGAIERFARDRSTGALVVALVVIVAKAAAGVAALALMRRRSRRLATLAAAGGIVLGIYGAVLTSVGALVLAGIIASSPEDHYALRWHVLLWDPWFLLWGIALAVTGVSIRRATPRPGGSRRSRATAARAS